jgi:hypothetical protein
MKAVEEILDKASIDADIFPSIDENEICKIIELSP